MCHTKKLFIQTQTREINLKAPDCRAINERLFINAHVCALVRRAKNAIEAAERVGHVRVLIGGRFGEGGDHALGRFFDFVKF